MIFIVQHIIGRIAVTESIHQNLIHHSPFCPIRCGKSGDDAKQILRAHRITDTELVKVALFLSLLNGEIIGKINNALGVSFGLEE